MLFTSAACALFALLPTLATASSHDAPSTHRSAKRAPEQFGLTGLGSTTSSGVAVGFHIDWIAGEKPQTLIERLGKPAAVIGGYIHLNLTNQTYWEMDDQVPSILPLASTTVYSPAVLPQFSLDQWTSNMTQTLANRMAALNAQGITVWLRFAYEMNGDWMAFGFDPTNYVPVWKEITTAVRAVAPKTYMLWAPNIKADNPSNSYGYDAYYPGAEYVDIAGLSFYWLGDGQISNDAPSSSYFSDGMSSFYSLYSGAHPIVLSETSAPFHYQVPSRFSSLGQDSELPGGGADGVDWASQTPADGDGSDEQTIKSQWFNEIASNNTIAQFPAFTAVIWFNLAKVGGTNGVLRLNDFRAIKAGNDTLTKYFRGIIGNETAYQQSLLPAVVSTTSSAPASTSSAAAAGGAAAGAASSGGSTTSSAASTSATVQGAASRLGQVGKGLVGGAVVGLGMVLLG